MTGDEFAAEVRYNQLQFGGTTSVAGFADGLSIGGLNPDFGTTATVRYGTLTDACVKPNFLLNATNNSACSNLTPALAGVYVWTSHSPAAVVVSAGNGQSASLNTSFTTPLTVRVTDLSGAALPGATVTFTAPASGASAVLSNGVLTGTSVNAIADASGLASVTATAAGGTGAYAVSAAVVGVASPVTFTLTNTAGIAVSGGSGQQAMVGAPFATPLSVVVTNSASAPVANAVVNFTVPGSGATATLSAASATTDASGVATITATAGVVVGSYNVTATLSGLAVSTTLALTNLVGAPASIAVSTGNAQSVTVGNPFPTALTVAVHDTYGNPIPGATVDFTAPSAGASASLSPPSATTTSTGMAATNASANIVAGGYNVTATVNGTAIATSLSLNNTAGPPASLTIVTGSGQSTAVVTPFPIPISVAVADVNGNMVSGATVLFAAPGGGASATFGAPSVVTGGTGQATDSVSANAIAGSYVATATVMGTSLSVTVALTNTPGTPASIGIVTGSGQSTGVGSSFAVPLTVVVADASGNVVPGATVTFAGPGTGASATPSAPSVTTGSTGQASVSASANTVAGGYAVVSSVAGTSIVAFFSLTNRPGAAASISVVGGNGQTATVSQTFTVPLTAAVRDAYNNAVPGAGVTFTAPATGATASLSPAAGTTSTSGTVSVSATAGSTSGSYAVVATADGTSLATSFTLTNGAGLPATIAVSGGSRQSTIVGTAFPDPLSVIVRDASGNTVPGVTVTLNAPSTGATAVFGANTLITDSDGTASISATAGTLPGDFNVTASVSGGMSDVFKLTSRPGAPASILIATGSSPQTAQVGAAPRNALGVTVTDHYGNGVPNTSVDFTAPATGSSATLSAANAITDAQGKASVTATVNTTLGTFNVAAVVTGTGLSASFTITIIAGAPAKIVVTSGSPQSTTVGKNIAQPLAVAVSDSFDNPVSAAQVVFAVPSTGASAVLGALTGATDATGVVSITAAANIVAGHYLVTASVAGGATPVTFDLTNLPDVPATLTAAPSSSPQSAQVTTPFANSLATSVRDQDGNSVSGVTVDFTLPGGGATVTLDVPSPITDANGQVAVAATAGTTAGDVVVTARVGAVAPVMFALSSIAGEPSALTADTGTSQEAVVATAFATRLGARLRDTFGNPVAGVTVTFTAPASGATATFDSAIAVTDSNGLASVAATAGIVASTTSYSVLASAAGAAAPAVYSLRNQPGSPAVIRASATSTPQNATVMTAFAHALEVEVVDAYGNAAPLATITFTAPAAPAATAILSVSTASTDPTGHAQVSATASETAGAYEVTATVAGVATPARFELGNLAGGAGSIAVSSGSSQSAHVNTAFAAPLQVIVRDRFGNPSPAVMVTFAAPDHGATAVLDSTTAVTDATGTALVTAHAGDTIGAYTVVASAPTAAASVPFALTNTAGGPSRITAVSGSGQHAMATAVFAAPLVVRVQDAFDNLVTGVTVTFTAPGSGASATLSAGSAVTDGSGLAQVTATANQLLGDYTVTASVPGVTAPATFTLTNDQITTAIALTASTVTPASQDLITLTAVLSSPLGAPTGTVHIAIDGAASVDVPVNGNGQAALPYRFVTLGQHLVVAKYDGDGRFGPVTSDTLELTVGRDAGSIGGGGCTVGPGGKPSGGTWLIALLGLGSCWLLRRRPRSSRRDSRAHANPITKVSLSAVVALAALGSLQAGVAHAQSATRGFALDRFMPSAAGSDWFAGDSLRIEGNLRPVFGVSADYDVDPLVLYNSDGSRRAVPVKGQMFLHVGGSLSLLDRFRIAVDLPVAPYQAGDSGVYNSEMVTGSDSGGVGDLAVAVDARLIGRYGQAFTLGAGAQVFLPTGNPDKFLGEGSVRAMPRIAAAGTVSMFLYSVQAGLMLREQTKFAGVDRGTDMTFAAAAGVAVLDRRLIVGPEVYGATGVGKWTSDNSVRQLPAEAMLGAHYRVTQEWRLGATGAIGISQGLGSPAERVLLSTEWSPSMTERRHPSPTTVAMAPTPAPTPEPEPAKAPVPLADRDSDGVPDDADACIDVAGVATTDPKTTGCPPPVADGDGDGIPDDKDACPAMAGVGSEDASQNGCPPRAPAVSISEKLFFSPKVADLNPASIDVLTQLVITLKAAPQIKLDVDGHSDDLGKDAFNEELSHKRANATADWLVAHGVPAQQLELHWYSNLRPALPHHDAASRRANRRVELHEESPLATPPSGH